VIGVLGGIGLLTIAARWQWLPAVPAFPLFIGIKCAILAIATYCGLRIRAPLRTFISAFSRLTASTDATLERELHRSMQRCRGFVVTIWACLVLAAFIGMLRPL
jgi:hypothetical protein